jgi:hypothetical protein
MTNADTIPILARLEIGFRTDSARLKQLEKDLAVTLHSARHFGRKHGAPDDWNTSWHQHWDQVDSSLQRLKALVQAMDDAVASNDLDRFEKALAAWDSLRIEDAKLAEALSAIRLQALGLNATVREEWNLVAGTLESHFDTIHACAEALQIKLELLKQYSREEVSHLVRDLLAKLPNRTRADGMDVAGYAQEYRQAADEIEQEHHKFTGFMNVVKALLMRVETPEVRVRANRSLRLDPA